MKEPMLDSTDSLQVLTHKNVNDICNVMRKQGSKNVKGTPNREQLVSVTAQQHLKLAAFLFHHRWICTFDWEVMGVQEDKVKLLAGKKGLKDNYKNPDMLPEVNKADMARAMEAIEEYLRLYHGVVITPLTYIIRKTRIVQTNSEYSRYVTPDNKMSAKMLNLPQDKNKLLFGAQCLFS